MANPKVHSGHISGQLIRYLRAELKDESITYDEPLKQVEGGFETSTYRFKLSGAALVQGYEGQEVWQHPSIRKDMIEYIRESTGIRVNTPAD